MTGHFYTTPFSPHNTARVDYKRTVFDAAYIFSMHVFHLHDAEHMAQVFVFIGLQLEGEPHFGFEVFVRAQAVPGNTIYIATKPVTLVVKLVELTPFI